MLHKDVFFLGLWCDRNSWWSRGSADFVDAVKQGFSDSRVDVDSLDRPWFRFANGHWALSRV